MKIFAAIFSGIIACTLLAACSLASIGEPDAVIAPDVGRNDASALIAAVKNLGPDGVPETHFEISALEAAMTANDPALIRTSAGAVFNLVAAELSGGLTPPEARLGWRMENDAPDPGALAEIEDKAFDTGDFAQAFAALAPQHPQYRQLKAALAAEGLDPEQRARLRLNMDRWRWMPDDLGTDYILVNVPAFELMLVRDGKITARRRVVTGSPALPTPQLRAMVTGVILNPTWFVPPSIVRESVGALLKNDPARAKRLGYYLGTDGGVRQKPGPANALGQMKLVMPNPCFVFLHDTPSKEAFQRETRALSHGCIRVEDATGFARMLLGEAITDNEFSEIMSKTQTVEIDLETPLPVYVTYLTAFAAEDGAVAFYTDVYGLDAPLLARFGGAQAKQADPIKSLIEEACPESANDAALPENL